MVDNGSTDGTVAYLKSCDDVTLIENDHNRGFPAAANQGIKAASGANVLLLNNDTIVTTGWLLRLLRALHEAPETGLVGPVSNNVSGEQRVPVSYDDLAQLDGFAWDWGRSHDRQTLHTDRLVGFCLLIKREVIDRVGLLDERFGIRNFEDDDFCRRAAAAGFDCLIVQDAFIHHEGSATFRGSGTNLGQVLRQNKQIYDEKWNGNGNAKSAASTRITPVKPELISANGNQ